MPTPLSVVPSPAKLSPAEQSLEAEIVSGFVMRHRALNHKPETIAGELAKLRAFRNFVALPPWEWRRQHMDAYGAGLNEKGYARETIRSRQGVVRRFLAYARHPGYDWNEKCLTLTGQHLREIATTDNTLRHLRGAPTTKRRNLTDNELVRLFTAIRKAIATASRRDQLTARQMHYTLLLFGLSFGARENEIRMGDLADLSPATTPEIKRYSPFEDFFIRFGKSYDGSPPKQRPAIATYPFRDNFAVINWYLKTVRPALQGPGSPPAIFLGVHGQRLRSDTISAIFLRYRILAGLSSDLTFHCLRHTFETKLHQCGLEPSVIKELLGHEDERTTLLYDHLGADFIKERVVAQQRAIVAKVAACHA